MKGKGFLEDCKHAIRVLEGIVQVALLTLIYYGTWVLFYRVAGVPAFAERGKWILMGVYAALLLIVLKLGDGFQYGHHRLTDVFAAQVISVTLVDLVTYFQLCLISNRMITPLPMLGALVLHILVSAGCSYLYTRLYHKLYVPHDMLLVYGNEDALELKFKMDTRGDRYAITEIIDIARGREAVIEAIARHDAVAINDIAGIKRNDLVKYCYDKGIRTYMVPKVSDIIIGGADDITLFDTPLRLIKGRGLSLPQRFFKRTMDIVLCLIAMIPAAPIMLLIALAIKLDDHGPVFYRQKRVTRDGETFDILKFRSMVVDAEKGGYDLSMRANGRDPRITRVGAFIRATRVDELPQLLNILHGEMSIVGPRPERVENVEAYARDIPEWHMREKVKGGLTGYAQIFGRYNTSPIDKTKLDIMYIENYSLFLDIKLILLTVRILFSKESTEGFDEAEKRAAMKEELLREMREREAKRASGK